ncbi:MAG: hypothetical protein FJZ87_00220 [Chloroflexi bacterium]|nr:hypothetical protein [Chloroflexota bacterium]
MNTLSSILRGMGGMLTRPARTGKSLASEKSLKPIAVFVIAFGLLQSLLFLISYLRKDYPPPAEVLEVWVEHWGEGVMLPFFNIPAESYRGFQAAILLPFCLALWLLMGGSARLVALLFGGRHSFETYLRITGFTFFTIWLIAAFIDFLYSGIFQDAVLRGLRGEYGAAVDFLLQIFMPIEYTILYGLAGVNIFIATRTIERFAWWKAALVGLAAFAWPMALVSSVVR